MESAEQMDMAELMEHFQEMQKWSTLDVSFQELSQELDEICAELEKFERASTVALVSGMLTLPEYQANCLRLELLTCFALYRCKGEQVAKSDDVARWFSKVGESRITLGEDPSEDVFVSVLQTKKRDYNIFEGLWENSTFYTQRILDLVETIPTISPAEFVCTPFISLLTISDAICERSGLRRYTLGAEDKVDTLSIENLPSEQELRQRVSFSQEDLKNMGIHSSLDRFVYAGEDDTKTLGASKGPYFLEAFAFISDAQGGLVAIQPSSLTVVARHFVISEMLNIGLHKAFDRVLLAQYAEHISKTGLFGKHRGLPVQWKRVNDAYVATASIEFDSGHIVSYYFFCPSVTTYSIDGFSKPFQIDEGVQRDFEQCIEGTVAYFKDCEEFTAGIHVFIGCGWGAGYVCEFDSPHHDDWHFLSLTVADLSRLSWLGNMSPSYIFRLQSSYEAALKAGVHIPNPNGILNLIGWARLNNGDIIPHADLASVPASDAQHFGLSIPLELIRDVRFDCDNAYDAHGALDTKQNWHLLRRAMPHAYFTSHSMERIYASITAVEEGALVSVYEGTRRYWFSLETPHMQDRNATFKLWEMAVEWIHRVCSELDVIAGEKGSVSSCKLYLVFEDCSAEPSDKTHLEPSDLHVLCECGDISPDNELTLRFKTGFMSLFKEPENIAERLFVHHVALAFLKLTTTPDKQLDGLASSITERVVTNSDARSFHVMYAHRFSDYVAESLPQKLVSNDLLDFAKAKVGLAWSVRERGAGNVIEGQRECTQFLNAVVRHLHDEICAALSAYNREDVLVRLQGNQAKARAEKLHWQRTSAAVIGLHGSGADVQKTFVEQTSKCSLASTSSGALVEMALCECRLEPSKPISDIALVDLMSKMALVMKLGGLSDSIHYSASAPRLQISPFGDVLFKDDFEEEVVFKMMGKAIGDKFLADAPKQRKVYGEHAPVPNEEIDLPDQFQSAWLAEVGISIGATRQLIDVLEDFAIKNGKYSIKLTVEEFKALAISSEVNEEQALSFLGYFSLYARASWSDIPDGCRPQDINSWRYGRRLAYTSKPILRLGSDENAALLIELGALRDGVMVVLGGAYEGRLDNEFFKSKPMRKWLGTAREGDSFARAVYEQFLENGWQARLEIKPTEILNQKLERDYGDVDVLAWHSELGKVLVIECKDLQFARTTTEVAALLSDYQGRDKVKSSGKTVPDKLKRHLERVRLLAENEPRLSKFTGVTDFCLESCLCFKGIVPMQYAKIDALEDTHVGSVDDILASVATTSAS